MLLHSKQCDFCGINLREFSKSTYMRVLLLFLRRIFDYELLMMLLYHCASCVKPEGRVFAFSALLCPRTSMLLFFAKLKEAFLPFCDANFAAVPRWLCCGYVSWWRETCRAAHAMFVHA